MSASAVNLKIVRVVFRLLQLPTECLITAGSFWVISLRMMWSSCYFFFFGKQPDDFNFLIV